MGGATLADGWRNVVRDGEAVSAMVGSELMGNGMATWADNDKKLLRGGRGIVRKV